MNFFSTRKLTGEETKEELKCIRCGDRPNVVQIMLDPRRGKTLRMYECRLPQPFSGHASCGQQRRLVNTTVPIATMSMLRIVSRITGSLNASSRQSRRVSSGLSQHCLQLRLGEFLRLPHSWLARRHYPIHRAGTGRQQRRLPLRHRPYLGFCGWRLVTALQAQTS